MAVRYEVRATQEESRSKKASHKQWHLNGVVKDARGSACHTKNTSARSRISKMFVGVLCHMTGGHSRARRERAPVRSSPHPWHGKWRKRLAKRARTQIRFALGNHPRSRWRTEQRARPNSQSGETRRAWPGFKFKDKNIPFIPSLTSPVLLKIEPV